VQVAEALLERAQRVYEKYGAVMVNMEGLSQVCRRPRFALLRWGLERAASEAAGCRLPCSMGSLQPGFCSRWKRHGHVWEGSLWMGPQC
jgi:hypothetical protein